MGTVTQSASHPVVQEHFVKTWLMSMATPKRVWDKVDSAHLISFLKSSRMKWWIKSEMSKKLQILLSGKRGNNQKNNSIGQSEP